MLFNPYEFIFGFIPVSVAVFILLGKFGLPRLSLWWLLIASLFFYSYFNLSFLFILLTSIVINYALGRILIEQTPHGRNVRGP